jgi:hypothetical protein
MHALFLFDITTQTSSLAGGSFSFWHDKRSAFSEIYRVLKPVAVAYIGRGFSRNLPVVTAKKNSQQAGQKHEI